MEGKNQAQAKILRISHSQSLTWTSEKTEAIIFNDVLHEIDPLQKLRQSSMIGLTQKALRAINAIWIIHSCKVRSKYTTKLCPGFSDEKCILWRIKALWWCMHSKRDRGLACFCCSIFSAVPKGMVCKEGNPDCSGVARQLDTNCSCFKDFCRFNKASQEDAHNL